MLALGLADEVALGVDVGAAEVLGLADGAVLGFAVGLGLTVGFGEGAGLGPTGFTSGYFLLLVSWNRKPTHPPALAFRSRTPTFEYFQPPPVPFALNNPQH